MHKPDYISDDGTVTLYRGDCLEIMPELPPVASCVTDPPYGIGEANGKNASRGKLAVSRDYGKKAWDNKRPDKDAFDLIRRVTATQVIFGGNYFADCLPPSPSWIVWDKDNGATDFADVELAWTSHKRAARKVKWRQQGFLCEPNTPKDIREHPTQKPLGVMLWIIGNYTNSGDTVLDPFMGSCTTGVACVKLGRRFIGIELDPEYFDIAVRRIEHAIAERDAELPLEFAK